MNNETNQGNGGNVGIILAHLALGVGQAIGDGIMARLNKPRGRKSSGYHGHYKPKGRHKKIKRDHWR